MTTDYEALVRKVVLAGEPEEVDQFVALLRSDLEGFIRLAGEGLRLGEIAARRAEERANTPEDRERVAWTFQYLYMALNNAVVAARLLIEGYPVPSGAMIRQIPEAIAVALLFSSRDLPDFRNFISEPEQYPTHKAVHRLNQKKVRKALGVDSGGPEELRSEGLQGLIDVVKTFDDMAHPSAGSAATTFMYDGSQRRDLGGNFDPAKADFYRDRLSLSLTAAQRIVELYDPVIGLLGGK